MKIDIPFFIRIVFFICLVTTIPSMIAIVHVPGVLPIGVLFLSITGIGITSLLGIFHD